MSDYISPVIMIMIGSMVLAMMSDNPRENVKRVAFVLVIIGILLVMSQ
jgi:EamA domain-containing membrane protein RarD